jgi:adenine-specific DNA-methyltransferase
LKPALSSQKLRGGYYTPQIIADFLANWAIRSPRASVLEPSCGDGALLGAAARVLVERGATRQTIAGLVQGVELDPLEAEKANNRLRALGVLGTPNQVYQGDFFSYCKEALLEERFFNLVVSEGRSFDAVIGNPPFVRYQNFPEEHRAVAFELMQRAGLHPNRLTNAWVPFLVAATLVLKDHSRLAMVIPAELLQVNYAAEIRQFLSDFYSKIVLITFRELVFKDIQQEVVLLLGERNGNEQHGIKIIELDGMDDLLIPERIEAVVAQLNPIEHSTEKWTQYFLDANEIGLLRALRAHPGLTVSGKVIDVDVGIVTGENQFFILTQQQVEQYGLQAFTQPMVSRSGHLRGARFTTTDWAENTEKQLPAFLFQPPAAPQDTLPAEVQQYIQQGEQEEVHQGYKCRIRPYWYRVPSVWTPDAFMLRQVHGYPKLILNETQASCTDTIHRVRFQPGADPKQVTAAFLNSLTFAFAEITGRSYGGGVLTFEPSEAEHLPLPLIGADRLDFEAIDAGLRNNDIQAVLDTTDQTLLVEGLGLSRCEAGMLRGMWEKLRDRRIGRKHKKATS